MSIVDGYRMDELIAIENAARAWANARRTAIANATPEAFAALAKAEADLAKEVGDAPSI